jgi:hypothetical protein
LGKKIFAKSQLLEKIITSLRGEMTVNQGWKLCGFLRESAEVSLTELSKFIPAPDKQADFQPRSNAYPRKDYD